MTESSKKKVPKGFRLKPKTIEQLKWLVENTNITTETDAIEESVDRHYRMRKAQKEGKEIILD